jgi:hypothetical protein
MLSQESIHYAKLDVLRTIVVIVSSHILVQTIGNKKFFNKGWLISSGGVLLGITIHGLITRNLNKFFNLSEPHKTVVKDIIKVGTMLLVKHLFEMTMNVEHKGIFGIENGNNWLMNVMLMVVGFMLYNLFLKDIMPKFLKDRPSLLETVKVGVATIFTDIIPDFDIEPSTLSIIAGRLIGIMSFNTLLPNGIE